MSRINNVKIAIITSEPYPMGSVGSYRLDTYCQALASLGAYIKVYITHPRNNSNNFTSNGSHSKVLYENFSLFKVKSALRNPFKRISNFFYAVSKIVINLIKDNPKFIIVYSYDIKLYIILRLLCNLIKSKLIIDRSEYPYKRHSLNRIQLIIENRVFKLFDGFIIMTRELVSFYSFIKNEKAQIFHLPMTVDTSRFTKLKKTTNELYFASVFGIHNRDSIIDTIKAYEIYLDSILIYNEQPLQLYLVGDINNLNDNGEAFEYAKRIKFNNLIHFTGILTGVIYDQFIKNAFCLITTAREYVSGGFPTKVGDYLSTGNVTIICSTGEISHYLTNGVDSLLSPPTDINNIAKNMIYVHLNKENAIQIGQNGLNLALSKFSMQSYLESFIDFLYKI